MPSVNCKPRMANRGKPFPWVSLGMFSSKGTVVPFSKPTIILKSVCRKCLNSKDKGTSRTQTHFSQGSVFSGVYEGSGTSVPSFSSPVWQHKTFCSAPPTCRAAPWLLCSSSGSDLFHQETLAGITEQFTFSQPSCSNIAGVHSLLLFNFFALSSSASPKIALQLYAFLE